MSGGMDNFNKVILGATVLLVVGVVSGIGYAGYILWRVILG